MLFIIFGEVTGGFRNPPVTHRILASIVIYISLHSSLYLLLYCYYFWVDLVPPWFRRGARLVPAYKCQYVKNRSEELAPSSLVSPNPHILQKKNYWPKASA